MLDQHRRDARRSVELSVRLQDDTGTWYQYKYDGGPGSSRLPVYLVPYIKHDSNVGIYR